MATGACLDCDSAGDRNCSPCHGSGKTLREHLSDAVVVFGHESSCSACGGSGHCPTSGGSGEVEVGGESG
jgi:DnaJ-class molecular chaperone